MKSVIVTGATSMLGIATIKECVRNGIRVVAISRKDSIRRECLPKSPLVDFVACELDELKYLELSEDDYFAFYHFGWGFTDKSTRDDESLQMRNVEFTLDAVNLARKYECTRFIGAGSQAEYGFKDEIITEETECTPETAYGRAKLKAYKEAKKLCANQNIEFVWTRTFSVYGVNDSPNVLTSYAINQFVNGNIAYFSSGEQFWNYLYEDDAGVYFWLLGIINAERYYEVLHDNRNSTLSCIINVGHTESKKLKIYIEEMRSALGEQFFYFLDPEKKAKGINPSVKRLIDITEYYPIVSFGNGIEMLANKKRKTNVI